jgi:phage terminase Nu1 subunit (DNA packaging protein)
MPTPRSPRAKALAIGAQERGRLTRVQARIAELKAPELQELFDTIKVGRTWGGVQLTMRATMLAGPSWIGPRLPQFDATDIDTIDRLTRDVLAKITTDDR